MVGSVDFHPKIIGILFPKLYRPSVSKKNLEEIQNQTAIGKIEKISKYRKKIERSKKDWSPNRKGK